jgi:hypothetical protein
LIYRFFPLIRAATRSGTSLAIPLFEDGGTTMMTTSREKFFFIGAAAMLAVSAIACGGQVGVPGEPSPTEPLPVVRPSPTTTPAPSPAPNAPAPSQPNAPSETPTQGEVSAPPPAAGCVRFEACVDGSDYVTVSGGVLTIQHRNFDPIGEHAACAGTRSAMASNVSLYDPNGTFAVDGVGAPLASGAGVPIASLTSFTVIQARGSVTPSGGGQLLFDDDAEGGPSVYVVDFCE